MRKIIILVTVLLILIGVGSFFLFLVITEPMNYKGITAEKLNEKPDIYVNISEQQMGRFPHLKASISSIVGSNRFGELVQTPLEEWNELNYFLEGQATNFIAYQDNYYEVTLVQA
jgi:hypothetical protein